MTKDHRMSFTMFLIIYPSVVVTEKRHDASSYPCVSMYYLSFSSLTSPTLEQKYPLVHSRCSFQKNLCK